MYNIHCTLCVCVLYDENSGWERLHVDPTSAVPTIHSSNLFFFNTKFLDFIKINFSSSFFTAYWISSLGLLRYIYWIHHPPQIYLLHFTYHGFIAIVFFSTLFLLMILFFGRGTRFDATCQSFKGDESWLSSQDLQSPQKRSVLYIYCQWQTCLLPPKWKHPKTKIKLQDMQLKVNNNSWTTTFWFWRIMYTHTHTHTQIPIVYLFPNFS
jgi:hypothetical protein